MMAKRGRPRASKTKAKLTLSIRRDLYGWARANIDNLSLFFENAVKNEKTFRRQGVVVEELALHSQDEKDEKPPHVRPDDPALKYQKKKEA